MSASGLSTVHAFTVMEYKWSCMYTWFLGGDAVLTAGGSSMTERCQGKLTTPQSAARRPEGSLAAEHPVAMTSLCCLHA
jgi:hypothetical protein